MLVEDVFFIIIIQLMSPTSLTDRLFFCVLYVCVFTFAHIPPNVRLLQHIICVSGRMYGNTYYNTTFKIIAKPDKNVVFHILSVYLNPKSCCLPCLYTNSVLTNYVKMRRCKRNHLWEWFHKTFSPSESAAPRLFNRYQLIVHQAGQ